MGAFFKFLGEKLWPLMVDRWGRRSTIFSVEIALVLGLLCWMTDGAISTVSYAQGAVVAIAAISIFTLWYGTVRVPKCRKNRIGIALAVFAENEEQHRILKADFIDEFKEMIDKSIELRDLFDIVEIPQRHARGIRTSDQANSYRSVARCQMIVYGHTRQRRERGKDTIKVHLDCLISHREVKREVSKIFSKDINAVFPMRLNIDAEDECQQFEFTAEWLSLAAKYIIGTASLLSDAPDLALSIFDSLKNTRQLNESKVPSIRNIKALIPIRLADVYRFQIHPLMTEWDKTKENNYLLQAREIILKLDSVAPGDYPGRLWKAIIYFVLDRNLVRALQEISNCSSQRDATWRYSRAFLLAYTGRLDEAKGEYEKAFDRECHESVPLQCETFITWVLSQEPEKTQLYYCLGLINWKAKCDLPQAIHDIEKFIELAPDAAYLEMKRVAAANLGTIKGELKEGE